MPENWMYWSYHRFKTLALSLVLLTSALALGFSALGFLHPTWRVSENLLTIFLWLCCLSASLLWVKSFYYKNHTRDNLPWILSVFYGINTLFAVVAPQAPLMFPRLFAALPPLGLWILAESATAGLVMVAIGWLLLQEPQKRKLPLHVLAGAAAFGFILIYGGYAGLAHWAQSAHPLFGFPALSVRWWFWLPVCLWGGAYALVFRRWLQMEYSCISLAASYGLLLRILANALETLPMGSQTSTPSPAFFTLLLGGYGLLFAGLLLELVHGNWVKVKTGEYLENAQKELSAHAREIEQVNQELENQIAQQQIQADLNHVLTLSLENAPLKEMLTTMLQHITTLPWMALTGAWAVYLSETSKETLHLRYSHALSPDWPEAFQALAWPACLCGNQHDPATAEVCTLSFGAKPSHPALCAPHFGVPLLNTAREPIGHLVLFAMPGASADQPVKAFLHSIATILVGVIQRKQIEETLRQERDKINQYLANAGLVFVILGTDQKVKMINRRGCELLGYPQYELLEKNWFKLCIPERLRGEVLEFFQSLLAHGQKDMDYFFENPILTRDGQERLVAWHSTIIKNSDDSIQAILASGEDITEQKQLQTQLLQAQKLESIGQLAAGIAHEINTPTQYVGDNIRFLQESFADLSALLGQLPEFLQACREKTLAPAQTEALQAALQKADLGYLLAEIPRAVEQSLEGISRVTTIVRAMKEFAHPDTGEKILTDLNHAIASTVTISRNEWKYVADLETDFDPALPLVPCLPGQFNQVILNMIVNAAHAIAAALGEHQDRKGTIKIQTRLASKYAEVQITDTGTGIPKEIIPKIFDPFFTTKKVGQGTGQGLAISRNVIVDKLKGSIDVKSEMGQGTQFTLRLPLEPVRQPVPA